MTNDFTYEKVDNKEFFKTLLQYLDYKSEYKLFALINQGYLEIQYTEYFSQKYSQFGRWDSYHAEVFFYIPVQFLSTIEFWHKRELTKYCKEIMPLNHGYDINLIEFKPLIKSKKSTVVEKLRNDFNQKSISDSLYSKILNPELINIAREMMDAYFYLFILENSLRVFLHTVFVKKMGTNYFTEIEIPSPVRSKITNRKNKEKKHKWLPIRGDNDFYYFDFKEIGNIIMSNWTIFSDYFPDQNFITSKINEIAEIRNLIAHNSAITEDHEDTLRVYSRQILSQISNTDLF